MIIDFRLRPPVGGFLDTLMYSAGERRDGFTRTVGFEPSPAAQKQSMELLLKEMDAAKIDRGVVVGRLAGVLGSVSNDDVRGIVTEHPGRFIGAASIDPTDRRKACQTINQAVKDGFKLINIEPGSYPVPMYADDRRLYPIYGHCEDIEVPVITRGDRLWLRVSAQVYNDDSDIEHLGDAVDEVLAAPSLLGSQE